MAIYIKQRVESIKRGKLLFTCWDNDAGILVQELIGISILDVVWLSCEIKIDLSFLLPDKKGLTYFPHTLANLG